MLQLNQILSARPLSLAEVLITPTGEENAIRSDRPAKGDGVRRAAIDPTFPRIEAPIVIADGDRNHTRVFVRTYSSGVLNLEFELSLN